MKTETSLDPREAALATRWHYRMLAFLAMVGALLLATTIPAPYLIDENAYLMTTVALRNGGLVVPGTEGLPPSQELFWFEPQKDGPWHRRAPAYPVTPPYYAVLSLPFLSLGWRGLVALNTLAFLATALLVGWLVREIVEDWRVPLLTTYAFLVGTYLLEYAQGLWPHMLSMFLCTLAYVLVRRARMYGEHRPACLAGLVVGVAVGVRYPNLIYAGGLALSLLFTRPGRRTVPSFALCMLPFLFGLAWINQIRLGVPNPVTKGGTYLSADADPVLRIREDRRREARILPAGFVPDGERVIYCLRSLLTFVVDSRFHPPLSKEEQEYQNWRRWNEGTRIITMEPGGVPKRAWLQSVPWGYVALLVLLGAWWRPPDRERSRAELRALGAVIFPWLLAFAYFGTDRYDGFCYNQRYLIDLVPLLAVALGIGIEGHLEFDLRTMVSGQAVGYLLGSVLLLGRSQDLRQVLVLTIPHLLGALLLLARQSGRRTLFSAVLMTSIVFAFCAHLLDDMVDAGSVRWYHAANHALLERNLPSPAALVVYRWSSTDAGLLILTHDIVVVDAWADGGRSVHDLITMLEDRGRPVFLVRFRMPEEIFRAATRGYRVERLSPAPVKAPLEDFLRSLLGPQGFQELVDAPRRDFLGVGPEEPLLEIVRLVREDRPVR